MKKPSSQLFFLIKSLSKSEKRYFRQYATRHTIGTKNNYLTLFDSIQAQEIYDEVALKEQLEEDSYGRYFAVAKQYLYLQLMESLHLFHQTNSIREKIKKQFHFCEILGQKGLSDQANQALKKANKWIHSYQLWEYVPVLVDLQRRVVWNTKMVKKNHFKIAYDLLDDSLVQLQEMSWYWQQNTNVLTLHYENVQLQDQHQQENLNILVDNLQEKGPPEQLQAQLGYYRTLSTAAFMSGRKEEAYFYNKTAMKLFDKHPKLIELEPQLYIGIFYNFLIDNFQMRNYSVAEDGILRLQKMSKIKAFKTFAQLDIKIVELTYNLQLNIKIAQQKFDEALELIPTLEKKMQQYRKSMALNSQIQFYYLMAYVLFMNQQYDKVLDHLATIQQSRYANVLEELMIVADWLYLMTHYEIGNYLLLNNLMVSVHRGHKKKLRFQKFEQELFRFLKKMANPILSKKEQQEFLTSFSSFLQETKKDTKEQRVWTYFNFDKWLENFKKC